MGKISEAYVQSSGDFLNFTSSYLKALIGYINGLDHRKLDDLKNILDTARCNNKKIFFVGNGGSASTASHCVCDFNIGPRNFETGFKCISLVDNVASLTAIGNDLSYTEVFTKQLANLGEKGDILILISASGNSKNIVNVAKFSKKMGMITIGWTGFKGSQLDDIVDLCINVDGENGDYGPVEDVHLIINHIIANYFIEKHKGI